MGRSYHPAAGASAALDIWGMAAAASAACKNSLRLVMSSIRRFLLRVRRLLHLERHAVASLRPRTAQLRTVFINLGLILPAHHFDAESELGIFLVDRAHRD